MDYYDSPTFLGQRDVYLIGLTMFQLLGLIGMALGVFVVLLLFPMSTLIRLALVLPITGVGGFLMYGRIAGLSVPVYVVCSLTAPFRHTAYEDSLPQALQGTEVWLAQQALRAAGVEDGGRSGLGRLRGKAKQVAETAESQRAQEARAEVEKGIAEGSVAVQQWVRDGLGSVFRGR